MSCLSHNVATDIIITFLKANATMSWSEVLTNLFHCRDRYLFILNKIKDLLAFSRQEKGFTYIANSIVNFGVLTKL